MNNLTVKIKGLLRPKDQLEKKQVALFLTQDTIDKLDENVKNLSNYSNIRISRNMLIEMAIDDLIDSIKEALDDYQSESSDNDNNYDLIICPSLYSGVNFIKNHNYWEFVKIDINKIKYLKYMALYVGAPESAIMYWGKIAKFEEFVIENQKKYRIFIDGDLKEINPPIKLNKLNALYARNIRYTTLEKLLNAKEYSDLIS